MNYTQAKELAATWVRLNSDDEAELVEKITIKKPYGWVFFYEAKDGALGGNAPIIINRLSLELRVTGTAYSTETYLKEYESTLPPVWLTMSLPREP